jgi:hypothetical protein
LIAFTFTAGWGALTTLVGTLGGVLVSQWFAQKGERDRATAAANERAEDRLHERELRDLELRDARGARLYTDRKTAYANYRIRLGEFRAQMMANIHEPSDLGRGLMQATIKALGNALIELEVVASKRVAAAAARVRSLVIEEGVLRAELSTSMWRAEDPRSDEHRESMGVLIGKLDTANEDLLTEIRGELELDL